MASGKDRGKEGKILKVLPKENLIVVEGLNLHKKHARAKQTDKKGEVVLIPGPVNFSKVQLICPHCSKPARIGFEVGGENKVRICKKCRQAI